MYTYRGAKTTAADAKKMQPIHYALQREYAECAKLLQVGYIHMYNTMHVYLPILSIRTPSQHAKDLIKSNSLSLYEIAIR